MCGIVEKHIKLVYIFERSKIGHALLYLASLLSVIFVVVTNFEVTLSLQPTPM